MSDCDRATTEPTMNVREATISRTGVRSHSTPASATYTTRSSAPNAATLTPAAMKPVTIVGAPW